MPAAQMWKLRGLYSTLLIVVVVVVLVVMVVVVVAVAVAVVVELSITSRSGATRWNGSTCADLVEDCKKATSVHFYVAIKSSQNKDNRIATITCTHHVQLPSLQ